MPGRVGRGYPTVIRGGAGIFYDTQLGWWRLGERAVIGGSGRQFIGNAAVTNPLTGQPFSTAFLNSLAFNYGTFLAQLPTLRAQQDAKYPGTGDAAADSPVQAGERARRAVSCTISRPPGPSTSTSVSSVS